MSEEFGTARRARVRMLPRLVCAVAVAVSWAVVLIRATGLDVDSYLVLVMAVFPWAVALGLLTLLAALLLRSWVLSAAAAAMVVAEVCLLLPRFLGGGGEIPADAPRLRVATSSAHAGAVDPAALVDLVRTERVDVLAVAELSAETARALDRAGMASLMPYRELHPEADSSLYSRLPLTDGGLLRLGTFWPQTGAAVRVGGRTVRLVAVHTYYPLGDPGRWDADMTALRDEARRRDEDTIFLGDFNATLDHARMRGLLAAGLTDVHDELGEGWAPTWPEGEWYPPLIQLDHVLHGPGLAAVSVHEEAVAGSDHRAVVAELALTD
ncbi:endonuclease/exonuclease/phosphatase family protein [Streptomyces avicenniae]|uniref:endonuclease/exonuclease/phosphatase family protein n=1 Tax=Streptomyces avicenniae TaxID=500153 RepID=UPI000AB5E281|nr:endonuclease/exonuclease/phosphatase family protein [Streptomyces avicenniae]